MFIIIATFSGELNCVIRRTNKILMVGEGGIMSLLL